ncbi:MAG: hypothetical protein HYZ69_02080 [Candidatus Colwellbacteria bacterium]|nr:hypothetical protein [Candidatus Colwellbacteria bacterium]
MDKELRICQNCKQQFTIELEDFKFYGKMQVPPPTFCPECRLVRRLAWINERTLYPRQVNGKNTISMYSPDKPFTIMEDKEWWSDTWNPLEYGVDYDFSTAFFQQFHELMLRVPLPHLQRDYATMVNSDYCNAAAGLKNCYLVVGADQSEDCSYCFSVENLKDCVDMLLSLRSELCYEGSGLKNCFKCIFSEDCEGSQELLFCRDCIGCTACLGSINLRNKSYYIFNKPHTKEGYYKTLESFRLGSMKAFEQKRKESEQFFLQHPRNFMHARKNEKVSGDYIYESKNVTDSFVVGRGENCRYAQHLKYVSTGTKDAYDYTQFGVGAELLYEAAWCGLGVSNVKFSLWNYGSQNLEYSFACHSSKNLFGCIGVRRGNFCILNKQYAKEEYEALLPKIIQHMKEMPYIDKKGRVYRYGEFFPAELSPFGYNETLAQYFFTLSQEEAQEKGYEWQRAGERNIQLTISTQNLPDDIAAVNEDITKGVIECAHQGPPAGGCNEQCTTGFRIIPQEFQFYKKMNLPLPRLCPNCRNYQRIARRNPLKLWQRKCQCAGMTSDNGIYKNTIEHFHKQNHCPNEFETSYSLQRPEIVYCEKCYLAEVA